MEMDRQYHCRCPQAEMTAAQFSAIIRKIKTARKVFLFLDFDGTLSPIVSSPYQAKISPKIKSILKNISSRPKFIVAVISGRMLDDIRKRVGIKNISYAGNHGLSIFIKEKKRYLKPNIKQYTILLKKLKIKLFSLKRQGAVIEDKNVILAVHYRNVGKNELRLFRKKFKEIITPYLLEGRLRLARGKKVVEIRPNIDFNKAEAVNFFENKFHKTKNDITIYIGDDVTDEDVFRYLRRGGISIRVGKKKRSFAKYFLRNQSQVKALLEILVKEI